MWYATRESVKRALDVKNTSRSDVQVDDALAGATDYIDQQLHRSFVPVLTTRKFDYPGNQYARAWMCWLDRNEIISVTSLATGGNVVDPSQYVLRRSDDMDTPPFDRIEILLSGNVAFGGGPTYQQDIQVTGWFGYSDTRRAAGTLAASVASASAGTVLVDAAGSAAIGVGDLLSIDSERLTVTGRTSVDTGQALTADVPGTSNVTLLPVASGAAFAVQEVITVDAERMLVVDVLGNNLSVRRAWDATPLSTHTTGTHVWSARQLTVTRGASGTTAATHSSAAPVQRQAAPALVQTAARALALDTLLNEQTGYTRVSGAGDSAQEMRGVALKALMDRLKSAYGRRGRTGTV